MFRPLRLFAHVQGICAFLAFFLALSANPSPAQTTKLFNWKPVNIQGMGYVIGIQIHPSGNIVIKTDVGGVYQWDSTKQEWLWLTRTLDWPSGGVDIESIALDPTRPNRVYAVFEQPKAFTTPWNTTNFNRFGEVLYTDNAGLTWTPTGLLNQEVPIAGNGNYRTNTGERLVADPNQPNILYFASRTRGIFRKDIAANTPWTQLAGGLPDPNTLDDNNTGWAGGRAGFTYIAFDPRPTTANTPTKCIYTGAYGLGVYQSTDGGQTWTLLADPQSRNRYPLRGQVAKDGVFWATFETFGAAPALRRYDPVAKSWSDVVLPGGTLTTATALALDPSNPNRVAVGGNWKGRSWTAIVIDRNATNSTYSATGHYVLRSPNSSYPDAELAANQPDYYFNDASTSPAALAFDPAQPARLLQGNGFGVVLTDNVNSTQAAWSWRMKGLEELVATSVKVPQSGNVQLYSAHMDMIGFRHLDRDQVPTMADRLLPFGHLVNPDYVVGSGWYGWVPFATYNPPRWPDGHVASAIGLDISARNPLFLAFTGMHQWTSPWEISGYSTDGGASWKPFPSVPTERMWTTRWIETSPGQWNPEDVERDLKAVGGVIAVGASIGSGLSTPPMVWAPKTMGANDRMTGSAGNRYLAATTAYGRLYYWDPAAQTWNRSVMRTPDPRPTDSGDVNQRNNYRFYDSLPLSWAHHFLGGPATVPYNYANIVAADRVDPNIFYYLSDGSGTRPNVWARLFASTDAGKTWDEIFYNFEGISGDTSITWSPRPALIPHPTRSGEVWICFGSNPDFSVKTAAFRAVRNGSTWTVTRVTSLASAEFVAFGKGSPNGPPAIYAKGRLTGMTRDAILQSLDDGATWTAISDPTTDAFPGALGLEGDMRTENLVYIYSAGRGVSYGMLPAAPAPAPAPTPNTASLRYDFETGIAGWETVVSTKNFGATLVQSAPSTPGANVVSGTRSLQVNVNATGSEMKTLMVRVDPGANQPRPGSRITFSIKVPPGPPISTMAFVQDKNWGWTSTNSGPRDSKGWQIATVTVPANAATPLNRLGLLIQLRGAWTGTIYIDAITW